MMKISKIEVGVRCRKSMGDIDGLARSITEVGLLHPVVVASDGKLIAGKRRIEACKLLGWDEIPVRVIPLKEIARGELAENVARKDFTPSEIDAMRRALEPLVKAKARHRMSEGARVGKVSTPSRTRDTIGAFAGISGRTVEKIAAVCEAAEREPEKYGKLVDDMDRTGCADGVHKRLKKMRQAEAILREKPPLPGRGPYHVIVADPPWLYELDETSSDSYRATPSYPKMPVADICAVRVADMAHDDCVLWLWTTNAHMRSAFEVLDAWGFEHKTILTWVKDKMGMGQWLRGQTEHCLMAVRGKPTVVLTNETTVLHAPRRAHSQKPDAFYELVEALCPAPRYAYLFSRNARPCWDGHGDEYPGRCSLDAPRPGDLATVIEQLPRVAAEVEAGCEASRNQANAGDEAAG